MLDSFCIFTKGGALLWTIQLAALRGDPVNALIRTCLLEERLGESSFSYTPPSGSAYTMKWTLNNVSRGFYVVCPSCLQAKYFTSIHAVQGLGLVFVAVYQRALKLLYVEELLERVKYEFSQQYKPDQVKETTLPCLLLRNKLKPQLRAFVQFKYKAFEESFRQMLKDAENSADTSKHSAQPVARSKVGWHLL